LPPLSVVVSKTASTLLDTKPLKNEFSAEFIVMILCPKPLSASHTAKNLSVLLASYITPIFMLASLLLKHVSLEKIFRKKNIRKKHLSAFHLRVHLSVHPDEVNKYPSAGLLSLPKKLLHLQAGVIDEKSANRSVNENARTKNKGKFCGVKVVYQKSFS
jgi:hypothetical protein